MIKICFVAPRAYPLFDKINNAPFGGSEVRIATIARELAARDQFFVSVIVGDYGQAHEKSIDKVHLVSWRERYFWGTQPYIGKNRFLGIFPFSPILQHLLQLYSRAFKRIKARVFQKDTIEIIGEYQTTKDLLAIYDEVDADIYVVPGNSYLSAEMAYYCAKQGKKYVFLAGSDFDYFSEFKYNPIGKDIYGTSHNLKTYSIKLADAHFVQNERQQRMLSEGYDRSSILIKNPIDTKQIFPRSVPKNTILWVGKSDERVKRPRLVIELAKQLPEYEFVIIMNVNILKEYMLRARDARRLPNVSLIKNVPFEMIEKYYSEARIHLNTSVFEGFPNTFLQAAKYGVPTVTMNVDPGGMLSTHACGLVSGEDIALLEKNIRRLIEDDNLYNNLSRNCLQYVQEHHEKSSITKKYEQAFLKVMKEGRIQ